MTTTEATTKMVTRPSIKFLLLLLIIIIISINYIKTIQSEFSKIAYFHHGSQSYSTSLYSMKKYGHILKLYSNTNNITNTTETININNTTTTTINNNNAIVDDVNDNHNNNNNNNNNNSKNIIINTSSNNSIGSSSNATSGRIFSGEKMRYFDEYEKIHKIMDKYITRNNNNNNNNNNNEEYSKRLHSILYKYDENNNNNNNNNFNRFCKKWSVVTTIFSPSIGIMKQANLKNWCLVIVSDHKTPHYEYDHFIMNHNRINNGIKNNNNHNNNNNIVVYLDIEFQKSLSEIVTFVNLTPWQSFSRKNLGYYYAISYGAEMIWDFDDDNIVNEDVFSSNQFHFEDDLNDILSYNNNNNNNNQVVVEERVVDVLELSRNKENQHENFNFVNPYLFFQPYEKKKMNHNNNNEIINVNKRNVSSSSMMSISSAVQKISNIWPRGYPISEINNKDTNHRNFDANILNNKNKNENTNKIIRYEMKPMTLTEIGMIQSLQENDPDVDAIYRMTGVLPVEFHCSSSSVSSSSLKLKKKNYNKYISISNNLYVPFNAQSTIFLKHTFWMLLLPKTVHGRVSDIWRSYFGQRMLHDTTLQTKLLFSCPFVTQYRNSHDYMADFDAESDLYYKTKSLLKNLDKWQSKKDNNNILLSTKFSTKNTIFIETYIELWIEMYEREYIEKEDIFYLSEWMIALDEINYQFPKLF